VAIRTGPIQESHQIGKLIRHWLLRNPDAGKKNCRASGLLEQGSFSRQLNAAAEEQRYLHKKI